MSLLKFVWRRLLAPPPQARRSRPLRPPDEIFCPPSYIPVAPEFYGMLTKRNGIAEEEPFHYENVITDPVWQMRHQRVMERRAAQQKERVDRGFDPR